MVSISCVITKGDLPIGIKWTFQGKTIDPSQGVTVVRTSKRITQLSIDNVNDVHSGEYTCAAKNPAGVVKHSAYLRVNGTSVEVLV